MEADVHVRVEIRGVNRRQAEVVIHLPREMECLETRVRTRVLSGVSRGRCEVRVTARFPVGKGGFSINEARAASYVAAFRRLAERLNLSSELSLDTLARCPGVLDADGEEEDGDVMWSWLQPALESAFSAFDTMRKREGDELEKDLELRIGHLRELLGEIRQHAEGMTDRYRQQLLDRIRAAGLEPVPLDDERLLKEIVLFADRCDISEELARLESHFIQFEDCRKSGEPVGRKLDFLAQEMNREINTIGSKANQSGISSAVVLLKTELERFREQAQNIE